MAAESMVEVEGGSSSSSSASKVRLQLWLPRRYDPFAPYSTGISTSGTTLSTVCTSGSSYLQSSDDIGGAVRVRDFDPDPRHVQDLVFEFGGGDAGAVDRWLSELGAGWVLELAGDDASQGKLWPLDHSARRWGRALLESTGCILGAVHSYDASNKSKIGENNFEDVHLLFVRFVEATLLKMLPLVTAICSVGIAKTFTFGSHDGWVVPPPEKLQALIELADAAQMAVHMTAKLGNYEQLSDMHKAVKVLDEAVWDTIGEIRTVIMSSEEEDDSARTETVQKFPLKKKILQRSPDVANITRAIFKCIWVLADQRTLVCRLVLKACEVGKYVPRNETNDPFISLIRDMVFCLEEKLAEKSQSIPDHSLRFLFLLNNTNFIWHQFDNAYVPSDVFPTDLEHKIDYYIQKYLQVSWAPVLSCLHNPTPLCLSLRGYSPLLKFNSEFQKIYTAQKFWKVPDPNLRRKLREAIIGKVTSGLTEYLEDNNITTPTVTPLELEEMLEVLFEG